MNAYLRFSYYYDDIFSELDYTDWLNFIEPYLNKESNILDLACGSGTLAILLKLKGYNVEGLDLSSSIIDVAKEKAKMHHLNIPFYVDDMTSFKLNKKYDIITCFFDSVNFLENKDKLNKLFENVYNHLNDDGLFIFDIFSKKLLDEYKNHKLKIKENTHKIIWKSKKINSSILRHNILIKEGKLKQNEQYYEYFHSLKDLKNNYFKEILISGDFKASYDINDERILLVYKKNN